METESLPEPVSISEFSTAVALAEPPLLLHHQPLPLLALALMEMVSSPAPVSRLELSRPFAVAGFPRHHQPPPLERALALMETESLPEPVSISEFSTAVACELPPLLDALTDRRSLPLPRSTSELARPLAVAGSFQPQLLAEALMLTESSPEPASIVESSAPKARMSP